VQTPCNRESRKREEVIDRVNLTGERERETTTSGTIDIKKKKEVIENEKNFNNVEGGGGRSAHVTKWGGEERDRF